MQSECAIHLQKWLVDIYRVHTTQSSEAQNGWAFPAARLNKLAPYLHRSGLASWPGCQGMPVPPHGEAKSHQTYSPTVPTIWGIALPLPHRRLQHMSLFSCEAGAKDMRIMDERKHATPAEQLIGLAAWLFDTSRAPTGDITHAHTPWKHPCTLTVSS